MSLRLVELLLPAKAESSIMSLMGEEGSLGIWREKLEEDRLLVRVLLHAEDTETVMDKINKRFSGSEDFRVIILPVEATLPRPELQEDSVPETEKTPEGEKQKPLRISREELYDDIADSSRFSYIYVVMVILSSIVAAIGLMNNNITVIIGAMVIAPLLGPNVAVSLATTLGDTVLVWRALKVNFSGILVGLLLSIGAGYIFHVSPDIPEIAARTRVGLADVVIALASGSAGALAFTTGVPAALIGVMVAVALLPPLVVLGMLLGSGFADRAFGALMLLLTNLICVNLAGVITFLIQGIRPVTWWEADRAKRATRIALVMWVLLLSALIAVILVSRKQH
jgi:uncharacterized hydrophobic protein (TIGR00341 family)